MNRPRTFLPALILTLCATAAGADVPRFETAGIILRASRTYDGAKGVPNPFVDLELTADVVSPSGRKVLVDGFFDGDGQGGMVGNVFKLRIPAEELGTWTWRTYSNDPGLNSQSGSFVCSGKIAGPFGSGPMEVNPQYPRTFRYRTGVPVYLSGKFLDDDAPDPLKWTQTFFSEALTDADRRAMLDRQLGMKVNKLNIYIANKGDYGGIWPTTPWLGTAAANDKTRFDLARWRLWETWLLELRRNGVAAHLWFFADDSGFGSLPDADRMLLIRFGMARLSPYVSTLFTLILEWEEGWSTDEVDRHMVYLQQKNPWRRLQSVHGQIGDFDFPQASWANFMELQAGATGYQGVYDRGIANRALAVKPLVQEEMGQGPENGGTRLKSWAAFMAGAGGAGGGAFLAPLSTFIARVPFQRMQPMNGLVLSGTAYALAEPGKAYVFFQPVNGTITVDLSAASGTLIVEWFDPRTGAWQTGPPVAGGGPVTLRSPASGDWAVFVHP
jgi:hypothetical protein